MSGADKKPEPGDWAQSEALRLNTLDQFWGLGWTSISAEKFAEFVCELTRAPGECSRNGGEHWSPTHAELADRLRVPVELVEDWAEEGVTEPWEICVVRAYARTGIVATTDDARVPPDQVVRALHRADGLRAAAKVTRIPLAMLERHLEVGAPAKTHGRAYLLMDCAEYRNAGMRNLLRRESAQADETIAKMLADGATIEDMATAVGLHASSIAGRMKKLGLVAARDRKGGRSAQQRDDRPEWMER